MIIHKKTGVQFSNRAEAKLFLGTNRYRRMVSRNEFEFINNKS